jgi:chromosome segregation ATPase
MGVIPEELIKDAPSFREFLAFYVKSQEDWDRRQKEWERKREEWERKREEEDRLQKEKREEWERKREEEDRLQKEKREEWERQREEEDRRQKEKREEWERQQARLAAQMAETDRKIAALSENVGGLNRSMGELIETLIAARLWEKFPEYGLQQAYRRLPIYDEKKVARAEIDILLMNDKWAMAVEVKREAVREDVNHSLERMARILKYPPAQLKIVPGVKLLGAIAGGVVEPDAREYAHSCGFYVLELAGESVVRVPDPPGFKPKEW